MMHGLGGSAASRHGLHPGPRQQGDFRPSGRGDPPGSN